MPDESNITDEVILPPECVVEEKWIDRVVVVSAAGTVDMLTSPKLEERINAAVAQKPPPWWWTSPMSNSWPPRA